MLMDPRPGCRAPVITQAMPFMCPERGEMTQVKVALAVPVSGSASGACHVPQRDPLAVIDSDTRRQRPMSPHAVRAAERLDTEIHALMFSEVAPSTTESPGFRRAPIRPVAIKSAAKESGLGSPGRIAPTRHRGAERICFMHLLAQWLAHRLLMPGGPDVLPPRDCGGSTRGAVGRAVLRRG